ncbi:glycoside hydrolase family 131 protein [Xylariaceae sp. FL1019]|nr:glycoside hydrolase family 131 protein [Xylariaceae sp. FL1019]
MKGMASSVVQELSNSSVAVVTQQCNLQFGERVPSNFFAAMLPTTSSTQTVFLYKVARVNRWMSLRDIDTIPVEVPIDDQSIFAPSADKVQTGFRRAELFIVSNDGKDASTTGVKTLHFRVRKDIAKPLNLNGTILGAVTTVSNTLQLVGNVNDSLVQTLFGTLFTVGVFHSFAVTLEFDVLLRHGTQYPAGLLLANEDALFAQTEEASANDVSGQGQFNFGVLKKGPNRGDDIVTNGEQESGINEGIIFGGLLEEDSSVGRVSLST